MSNRNFEEDYIKAARLSAPDMDKLWEKISSSEPADNDVTPFESAMQECVNVPVKPRAEIFRIFASAAAVFAAVFCISLAVSTPADMSKNDAEPEQIYIGENADNAEESNEAYLYETDVRQIKAVSGWDYSHEISGSLSYDTLSLSYTESDPYSGILSDEVQQEYFVEEDVLSETDYFLDCRVISSQLSENGIAYTVEVIHFIGNDNEYIPEEFTVYSKSPYSLKTNREYLLPVTQTGDDPPFIAFDNAPQIELSEEREVICHNGWQSLAAEGEFISYPQAYKDDYFYDRMNITAEASLENLFDKWRELHA